MNVQNTQLTFKWNGSSPLARKVLGGALGVTSFVLHEVLCEAKINVFNVSPNFYFRTCSSCCHAQDACHAQDKFLQRHLAHLGITSLRLDCTSSVADGILGVLCRVLCLVADGLQSTRELSVRQGIQDRIGRHTPSSH